MKILLIKRFQTYPVFGWVWATILLDKFRSRSQNHKRKEEVNKLLMKFQWVRWYLYFWHLYAFETKHNLEELERVISLIRINNVLSMLKLLINGRFFGLIGLYLVFKKLKWTSIFPFISAEKILYLRCLL